MESRKPVSTDKNYYKDLWNDPRTEAGQFFNKVDFQSQGYKRQEEVFRGFLKGLRALKELHEDQKPIETVLEVGCGNGRMLKTIIEELHPSIYDTVDIKIDDSIKPLFNNWYEMDITNNDFDEVIRGKQYDLILASEVFMHIKPEDISPIISKLTKLLAPNAIIINIDWVYQPQESTWCYIHDYDKLYRINGLHPMFEADIKEINQKLFCYGK